MTTRHHETHPRKAERCGVNIRWEDFADPYKRRWWLRGLRDMAGGKPVNRLPRAAAPWYADGVDWLVGWRERYSRTPPTEGLVRARGA